MSTSDRLVIGALVTMLLVFSPTILLAQNAERTFAQDLQFVAKFAKTIVLGDTDGGPRVLVVPDYQGRVMTSSARGEAGGSYGWVNYEKVESGPQQDASINVFGGEERFWLGPEGGQFGIYFAPNSSFTLADWRTPPAIDTVPFGVTDQDVRSVAFQHSANFTNHSGTVFHVRIDRKIYLMESAAIEQSLDVAVDEVAVVGYRTTNRITNIGPIDWTEQSGLLSIWLLGMYKPGPKTTVVIPFKQGPSDELGKIVNDDYFGKVPPKRLRVTEGVLFFAADGQYRSKIGLSPQRSTPICGSWDAGRNVLTIVKYSQPNSAVSKYVNSKWEFQEQPYAGDVINSYNDGPPDPGSKPLGPFYELETSSPALALKQGESGQHVQETYHFEGDREKLGEIATSLLGVTLSEIESALRT